jgi:catechol 2,3-dioxygenase-like lactoylglutathione lyase family enzyme
MIKVRRMGHATFETTDLDKQIDYYTQIAGLALVAREKDRAFLAARAGTLAIELRQASEKRCARLSFQVSPEEDFTDMAKRLSAEGIKNDIKSDATPGTPKVISFTDPKGTTIELFTEFKTLGREQNPGGIGPYKLGHLAFHVSDPKAIAEFYIKVLGFKVSDWIADFFVFLRCNADHHVVNFIQGPDVKMHHIAFELRDFSHLQNACDIFGQKEIPILWGPVRLGPGHNVATFNKNADDWMVEYFCELDQMKDEALGYFDPRPWHKDNPQYPKVWDSHGAAFIWGPPPSPTFLGRK